MNKLPSPKKSPSKKVSKNDLLSPQKVEKIANQLLSTIEMGSSMAKGSPNKARKNIIVDKKKEQSEIV